MRRGSLRPMDAQKTAGGPSPKQRRTVLALTGFVGLCWALMTLHAALWMFAPSLLVVDLFAIASVGLVAALPVGRPAHHRPVRGGVQDFDLIFSIRSLTISAMSLPSLPPPPALPTICSHSLMVSAGSALLK